MIDLDNKHPTRDDLWEVVEKAHDYLSVHLNDPSNAVHPTHGQIHFDTSTWGTQVRESLAVVEGAGCKVCLAGLLYLQEQGRLLGEEKLEAGPDFIVPPIANFLDCLRYPHTQAQQIERWLGVSNTYRITISNIWDTTDPTHILDYLGWLLEQKGVVSNAA